MQSLVAIHNFPIDLQQTAGSCSKVGLSVFGGSLASSSGGHPGRGSKASQMQSTLDAANQLKHRLARAIDTQTYEIRDRDELARIVTELPKVRLTKADLEETRLGKLINDIRKNATALDKSLAKTLRGVVKAWRDLCELKPATGSQTNGSQTNGNSNGNSNGIANGNFNANSNGLSMVQSPSASLISSSSLSNDGFSRHFNGQGNGYTNGTTNGKENAASEQQHPALLRVRNQHTPLTSPSKDLSYLSISLSPKMIGSAVSSPSGRKRKAEPDTLRENLNSVLNSASGRKAQSTQEIFQNVLKNNPLSCQSSPAISNGFSQSQPVTQAQQSQSSQAKKPRLVNNLAYLDENAVDNFDAARWQSQPTQLPAVNGFSTNSNSKPEPETHSLPAPDGNDSENSQSSDVPYDFDKADHTVDDELAELYARLPRITEQDVDAVRGIRFDTDVEPESPLETDHQQSDAKEKAVSMEDYNEDEYETFQYMEEYEEEVLEEVEVTDDEYQSAQEDNADEEPQVKELPQVKEELCGDEADPKAEAGEEAGPPSPPWVSFEPSFDLPEPVIDPELYPVAEQESDLALITQPSYLDEFEFTSPFLRKLTVVCDPPPAKEQETGSEEPQDKDEKAEEKETGSEEAKMEIDEPITPKSEEGSMKMYSDKSESVLSSQDNDDYEDDDDDDEDDDEESKDNDESEDLGDTAPKRLIEDLVLPVKHRKTVVKKVMRRRFRPKTGRMTVKRDVMDKFANSQWEGMNGNYDDEGVWCSYGDMSYVKPLMAADGQIVKNDDLDEMFNTDFVVLPYTNCSW